MIDPAMGSAHILVYAYDVLMDIYLSRGWSPKMAAKTIITQNLYGLDIDKRAYQLRYFSLMMKAWKDLEDPVNAQPHLANFADAAYYKDLSKLKGDVRAFAEQFRSADTYGSLMTVKPPKDEAAVREAADNSPDFLELALDQMLKISNILNKRYDVVCSNPPYMGSSGMGAKLSEFVKTYFPSAKSDLFACFMVKAQHLLKSSGYFAMITQHAWMFLSSYETLRKELFYKTTVNMAHMGARL